MKDPQARRLFDPEVVTKHFARTEPAFYKDEGNCFTKIIRQGTSGPGIIKEIHSPLERAPPPILHRRESERFRPVRRLKFGADILGFQPFEREGTDHHSLFHLIP
jgi:hypothetical protein